MSNDVSIIIATFNRTALLEELLDDLAAQDIDPSSFEAIVIDDGSREPVAPRLEQRRDPFALHVITQENQGQAAARHKGIERAQGQNIVIVDDDMRFGPGFLAAHQGALASGYDVVLGAMIPADDGLELVERWHARELERYAERARRPGFEIRGGDLATGNVSFRRQLYLDVGGFDRALRRSEDKELGIRFEMAGARIGFSAAAVTLNRSDHTSVEGWLERSRQYGVHERRIADKHPEHENADPWKFLFMVSPVSRPLLTLAAVAPPVGGVLARAAAETARLVEPGSEKAAFAGATLAFGLAYFRGLGEESGSKRALARGFAKYLGKRGREQLARGKQSLSGATAELGRALDGDWAAMQAGRAKYLAEDMGDANYPVEVVRKMGLQMMVAIRLMRWLRDSPVPLGGEVASRLIRHVYAAEIHWDAEIGLGTNIIHGNGLVISHAARVGERCILAHNVTLGASRDPATGTSGAPTLEDEVHVGPGAILLGPITVGRGSKIMAGALLTRSVPPGSLVRPGETVIGTRARRAPAAE